MKNTFTRIKSDVTIHGSMNPFASIKHKAIAETVKNWAEINEQKIYLIGRAEKLMAKEN